nr:uncharacterized protein LOC109155304 [Ipomoea trifida]
MSAGFHRDLRLHSSAIVAGKKNRQGRRETSEQGRPPVIVPVTAGGTRMRWRGERHRSASPITAGVRLLVAVDKEDGKCDEEAHATAGASYDNTSGNMTPTSRPLDNVTSANVQDEIQSLKATILLMQQRLDAIDGGRAGTSSSPPSQTD